jgi:hypothetical protein
MRVFGINSLALTSSATIRSTTVRKNTRDDITTNTVEGCYSIFKRVMKGIYQHCSEASASLLGRV